MSSQDNYIERVKGHKSTYDPKAWAKMQQALEAQSGANRKRKKYFLFRLATAAVFVLLAVYVGISDSFHFRTYDPSDKEITSSLKKGPENVGVKTDSTNVVLAEENRHDLSRKLTTSFSKTDQSVKELVKPFNGEKEPLLNECIEPINADFQQSYISRLGMPMYHQNRHEYLKSLKIDPIGVKFPEVFKADTINQRKRTLIDPWKFFVTAGVTSAKNTPENSRGVLRNTFYAGFGFNLSRKIVFQADFGGNYFYSSFSYLFGDGRLKFGPELGLLVVKDVLGPSFGVGAYYHTSEKFRFFTRFSHTNFRFFGEGQSTVSKISLGAQVSLGNFEKWQRRGFSQRGANDLRRGLSSRNKEEWNWYAYTYAGLDQFFGHAGNVGFGAGKYLTSKSFVQLGFRLPVRGYSQKKDPMYLDNSGIQLNYNLLFGKYRWYGLMQAGLNLRTGYSNFTAQKYGKGTFATNLGLGTLFKATGNVRMHFMLNVNDPYTTYSFWPRASFQIGAQFKF